MENEITVIITTISEPRGKGISEHKLLHSNFGVNEQARIRIENTNDNFCLFYALELARIYHDQYKIKQLQKLKRPIPADLVSKWKFGRIKKYQTTLRNNPLKIMVNKLMEGAKISNNEEAYEIKHIEMVQRYYNEKYPGMYRIILMDNNPERKPLWKAPLSDALYQVAIYYENDHYDALSSIAKYYGARKYCVDCAVFYSWDVLHRFRCKARCYGCSTVKNGQCSNQEGISIFCPSCNKTFRNVQCYQKHQNSTCRMYKRCSNCMEFYCTNFEHICGNRYCRLCNVYHDPERGCFIEPLNDENKTTRIMVFDFEVYNFKNIRYK